jgi:hypothetical protein
MSAGSTAFKIRVDSRPVCSSSRACASRFSRRNGVGTRADSASSAATIWALLHGIDARHVSYVIVVRSCQQTVGVMGCDQPWPQVIPIVCPFLCDGRATSMTIVWPLRDDPAVRVQSISG